MRQVIFLQSKLLRAFERAFRNGNHRKVALNLADLRAISEAARIESMNALAEQYQRISALRQIPRNISQSAPLWRREIFSQPPAILPPDWTQPRTSHRQEKGNMRSASLARSQFDDNKPVPSQHQRMPARREMIAIIDQTTPPRQCNSSRSSTDVSSNRTQPRTPDHLQKKSMMCAEALILLRDDGKPIPPRDICSCGYSWYSSSCHFYLGRARAGPRFLAKSHCEGNGWICILCGHDRCGLVTNYQTIESLAMHIASSHLMSEIIEEIDITVPWCS
jgi:hypothetical protein